MSDEPIERLVRSLKNDLDAAVAERDTLQGRLDAWESVVTEKALLDAGKVVWLEACVRELEAERDQLRAGIMTAEVHGEMIVRMRKSVWQKFEFERDRLRTVVEQALALGETEGMARGKVPYPEWWVLLDRALDPRERQLDVSPTEEGT